MSLRKEKQLVFFDLETSGLDDNADVLQIGMKYDDSQFNVYIMPTKKIPVEASRINNLTFHNGNLYYKKKQLITVSEHEALKSLLEYLRKFDNHCVLVAHNCPFDYYYLLRMIRKERMIEEFSNVIDGFTDTLEMLGQKFPDRRYVRGMLTLKTLAKELSLSADDAHDAKHDVYLMEKIAFHHFDYRKLIKSRKSFFYALNAPRNRRY